jgi:flagellar hook-associated protein 3 FlgL
VNGEEVFGVRGSGTQVFEVLSSISAALRSGDRAAMDAGLANLDTAVDRVITTLGKVGARFNRVETMRGAADAQLLSMTTSLSEAEDIDLPKTIVELQMQEVAYKAALGATARAVQPSLLDFLR